MRYNEIVSEGINDKGIFKAIFFAGLPGAGKSTVAKAITDGQVQPRVVNTDKGFEFLSKKSGMVPDSTAWALVGKQSQNLTTTMLYQYLNGMLPLYIDGTSSHAQSTIKRDKLLGSLGYDTAMVWVHVDLDTAIHRAEQRERKVDKEFIEEVYNAIQKNKEFYQKRFSDRFIMVDNSDHGGNVNSSVVGYASKFFSAPVTNPVGVRIETKLREEGNKTIVPHVMSEGDLKQIISHWY